MQQVDVERSQEFRKCIECFLCQDTCHVVRDHEENKPAFAGPRFLMRLAELDMHPLDTVDRKAAAQDDFGLGMCNITKCCSEVCPEGIHITDNALIPLKERVVDRRYDPLHLAGAARSAGAAEPGSVLEAEADLERHLEGVDLAVRRRDRGSRWPRTTRRCARCGDTRATPLRMACCTDSGDEPTTSVMR